jgi:2Fe-2S ferredoxin
MITIHVTGRDGVRTSHQVPTGDPLMFILRDEIRAPVEGACGGSAICGTCHIYVFGAWAGRLDPVQDYELAMLEHRDDDASRLSCQIPVSDKIDGLELTLAPEE